MLNGRLRRSIADCGSIKLIVIHNQRTSGIVGNTGTTIVWLVVPGRRQFGYINPENAPMARNDMLGAFDVGRLGHQTAWTGTPRLYREIDRPMPQYPASSMHHACN